MTCLTLVCKPRAGSDEILTRERTDEGKPRDESANMCPECHAAAALADGIGATLRDFTDFEPSPPEGLIEVWLAGREVGGSGGGSNQSGGALDQIGADLRRLEQGLRRALGGN